MKKLQLLLLALFTTLTLFSQSTVNPWNDVKERSFAKKDAVRHIVPNKYRTLSLDPVALQGVLAQAPMRFSEAAKVAQPTISVPMPDGTFQDFQLVEAPVMSPELAAKYPEMRSFAGWSDADPTAYLRCGVTPKGFHAVVYSAQHSSVFIDAYAEGDVENYVCYFKKDYPKTQEFECLVEDSPVSDLQNPQVETPTPQSLAGDCKLRAYALALACTGEYATFHGGTVVSVMAAYNVAMTRVNGIYEKDITATMLLVPNTDLLIFLNAASDPYTNNNGGTMLGQNQTTCTNIIGSANYDIGHVFSTGGGGIASLNSVCSNNNKARGVTGLGSPIGDPFYVDYVAHEMGHQFGGNHTFNSNQGSCSGNQSNSTAMEPGSASTIMGYAGICGSHNLQPNSDDYFHAISINEMTAHITGSANACATSTVTGNNAPTVTVPNTFYNVPISTPFALTATGTDLDGNTLTYCWEQMNPQTATMPPLSTNTGGPAFRSLSPTMSPTRYFPNLTAILANTSPTWEVLPSVTRTMSFRCTVRDNFPTAGCTDETDVQLSFTAAAGPFVVTNPNTAAVVWTIGETQTVTWNVANTTAAPISTSMVDIYLSTDGGQTYPILLLANAVNDGSQAVTVPNNVTNTARVMVRAVNNIYFDISNQNFKIQAPLVPTFTLTASPSEVEVCNDQTAEFTLNLTSLAGFVESISLTATGAPAGSVVVFEPTTLTPSGNTTLSISNLSGVAPGTYPVTVTATSLSVTNTLDVQFTILDTVAAGLALTSPADGATGVAVNPTPLVWGAAAGAADYVVEVSTSPSFSSITYTATLAGGNSIGIPGLLPASVYYWRVRAQNICDAGYFSEVNAFQTGGLVCDTYASTTPILIPLNGPATFSGQINVPNSNPIVSIAVQTDISHTYTGDLKARIISPSGTSRYLFDQPGFPATNFGCPNDDIEASFFDAASNSADDFENTCDAGPPSVAGEFQPFQPFSTLTGTNSAGNWTLEIEDTYPSEDEGAVNSWSLEICGSTPTPVASLLTNAVLTVPQGGSEIVSEAYLEANIAPAVFTLLTLPSNGTLFIFNVPLQIGSSFTQGQISNGDISYQHDGSDVLSDQFVFDVSDNDNGWLHGQVFQITVIENNLVAVAELSEAIDCHDNSNGILVVNATGGNPPFAYSLNGGTPQDSPIFESLSAGDYAVEVTDELGFIITTNTVTIDNPIAVDVSTDVVADDLTVTASGGMPPYQYSLNGIDFQNENVFLDLANGVYTSTVMDANGCTFFTQALVAVNTIVVAANVTNTVSCNGGSDGQVTINAAGGSTPYLYSLDGGMFQTSNVFNGLSAGNYTFTVKDNDGLEQSVMASLIEPLLLTGSASSTGYNINVTANGGSGVLQYSLDGGASQTTTTFFPVAAGDHLVTITDSKGCSIETPVTVSVLTLMVNVVYLDSLACANSEDGTLTVTAMGGVGPYEYSLNGGEYQDSNVFDNIAVGTYNISVKDSGGFVISSGDFTIAAPEALTISAIATGADITLTAGGGVAPLTYSLDGGAFQPSNVFTNIPNGSYTATVQDANGCETATTVTVSVPTMQVVASLQQGITCHDDNDAIIVFTASGGTPPLEYSLDGVVFQTSNTFTGVGPGTYNVTVKDATGTTVSPPDVVVVNPSVISASGSAFGPDITVVASGGTGALQYSLDGGTFQTSNMFNVLFNDTYTVTVMDANGCTTEVEVVVNKPEFVSYVITPANCANSADGEIVIENVDGGFPPYLFSLNGGPFTSSLTYGGLTIGEYIFYVQDATGYQWEAHPVLIDAPAPILVTTALAGRDLTITASGGVGALQYSVDGGATFQSSNVFLNLPNGTYDIVVKDENDCTVEAAVTVFVSGLNDKDGGLLFEVLPNPSSGLFNLKMDLSNASQLELAVYDVTGRTVFLSKTDLSGQATQALDLRHLSNGVYHLRVTDGEMWGVKRLVIAR